MSNLQFAVPFAFIQCVPAQPPILLRCPARVRCWQPDGRRRFTATMTRATVPAAALRAPLPYPPQLP